MEGGYTMEYNEFKQLDDISLTDDVDAAQDMSISEADMYEMAAAGYPKRMMDTDGTVFQVLENVLSWTQRDRCVDLIVETVPFVNRRFWTHETMLYGLRDEPTVSRQTALFRIEYYHEHVFRFHYNGGEVYDAGVDLTALPTQMLSGEPDANLSWHVQEYPDCLEICADDVRIHIQKSPLHIAIYQNQKVIFSQNNIRTRTSDSFRTSIGRMGNRASYFEAITLHPQEKIYGLGERFDHVERTGKDVDFWNKDAVGTSSRRTYINIPFYWSTRGYGLFLNTYGQKQWEIGTRDSGTITLGTDDECMDYFVIAEPRPRDIMRRYYDLTGTPDMPPIWSFGLWMSRNSYLSWDVVDQVVKDMEDREIPFDVIHLDTAWFAEDWNCDLRFSKDRFPEPEQHIQALKERGIWTSLWQYNFIPEKETNLNLQEAKDRGYLAKAKDGSVFRFPDFVQGSWVDDNIIDFSNPEAAQWYIDQIMALIDMGVGAIKTDLGEGIPRDAVYQKIDGRYFHDYYSLVYNDLIYKAIKSRSDDVLVWARSGTAGSQRYPVHWGGDSQCTWGGLAGTMKGLLSTSMSGLAFFSHDIGGFIGRPTPELYIRWAQLGLLSSHARCHGSGNENSREPSSFGEEAATIFREYARLRYRLLPYIVAQSEQTLRQGLPLMRGLAMIFDQDPGVHHIEDEYMLGDHLLIAPVIEPMDSNPCRMIYLPQGADWMDYHTGQRMSCGYCNVPVRLDRMPMYVRTDAVIPYGPNRMRTHNTLERVEEIHIYPDFQGVWTYDCDGIQIRMVVEEQQVQSIRHNQADDPLVVFPAMDV